MGTAHTRALGQLASGASEAYYKSGLGEQVCRVRVCGLCDCDPAKLESLAGPPLFQEHGDLLRATRPDIAIIATPTRSHVDLAMATLDAGVHTFVEKPATTQLRQWQALAQLAARQDLRIMAGHVERYNPVAIKLRAMLADGALRVRDYAFRRCQPHDPRIPDDIVADKLIHDLDLSVFLFGPVADHAVRQFRRHEGQTREVTLALTHVSGVTGELFVSWMQNDARNVRECRLRTSDGREAHGDFAAKQLTVHTQAVTCAVPGWVKPDNNQIKDELADFVGYCVAPDPALPAVMPLLSPAEVGAGIAIIEQVAAEIAQRSPTPAAEAC